MCWYPLLPAEYTAEYLGSLSCLGALLLRLTPTEDSGGSGCVCVAYGLHVLHLLVFVVAQPTFILAGGVPIWPACALIRRGCRQPGSHQEATMKSHAVQFPPRYCDCWPSSGLQRSASRTLSHNFLCSGRISDSQSRSTAILARPRRRHTMQGDNRNPQA